MSSDEQTIAKNSEEETTKSTPFVAVAEDLPSASDLYEKEIAEKKLIAKELYSQGSRNFLVKSYAKAADELSQVCEYYEDLYGELSDELGMPYLLYAKSLIALALGENKVIDVPDEEEDDDDEDEDEAEGAEEDAAATGSTNGAANDRKLESVTEDDTDTNTVEEADKQVQDDKLEKVNEDSEVTSTEEQNDEAEKPVNGKTNDVREETLPVNDGEMPSTSNGNADQDVEEIASNLQLAWEILELASRIFSRQGECGLPNLAEVQTELGNIEFENNILDSAREDYEKALNIYEKLPNNYRRAMAEIHYKIGLTFLMQQQNKEGATSLKEACNLIAGEIDEIKTKPELNEKDKNNIQDMEETKQEIEAKIIEIEEAQAQNIAEVRAALDSYIKPLSSGDVDAGSSKSATATSFSASASSSITANGKSSLSPSSSAAITSSSKPTDISHLIKRKKPEEPTSEAEAAAICSPAKRPAV